ncbi:metallophosphoesterase family protein [Halalkalicoccus jeotgali]|uniref:Phosphodiesterase n=1 Tax=Halalkalicoccus jeotgali (strain DSM 18796 / CECT 7217 / JCM 14584 / KCTC 4019 / B3) TaxID=795797 RepID=D8J4G8_HALJB|nr:metallophosphoesterase family protein [Halalkalicoccus jeotgali]ADJ13530.1 phosphodiesterase, MJ0936 family protein [Halalkalicoccus jeotgali B3]ELY32995.1 phosphodiesterase [Halalkalicoccus jeotgali B3]
MRVGLISDVHANRVALSAVLEDMPPVDHLFCAGDVVGYNPWPAECVEAVRERAVPTVMGNHDRAVAEDAAFRFNAMAKAGVEYASQELSEDQSEWLARLPEERTELEDRVKLIHGHPDDPDRYTYPEEFGPDLLEEEDLLVLGHTHIQGHAVYEEGIVCNPGSVGQPRDGDPRAAYAVVDLEERSVEERRVAYDIDRVIEAVAGVGLPERIGSRLREGR